MFSSARISSSILLCSSRTVSGSTRNPSRSRHQPLKSTLHTSLGCVAFRPWPNRPVSVDRRTRRRSVKPARSSTRLKLLSLGTSPPCFR